MVGLVAFVTEYTFFIYLAADLTGSVLLQLIVRSKQFDLGQLPYNGAAGWLAQTVGARCHSSPAVMGCLAVSRAYHVLYPVHWDSSDVEL